MMRIILRGSRKRKFSIETPCSASFTASALRTPCRASTFENPDVFEISEEASGLKYVAAVTGDQSRALRIIIRWRAKEPDETAAALAELKFLLAGIRRVNL